MRRLFGGPEPTSIYEHVRSHLRPDGPGMLEDGATLPDDEFLEGELRWAPGALEGAFSRYAARAALRSPVIRHRHQALRAMSLWPGGLDAERAAAVRAAESDPDDAVREDARKVLAGEPLEEPTLDLDDEA